MAVYGHLASCPAECGTSCYGFAVDLKQIFDRNAVFLHAISATILVLSPAYLRGSATKTFTRLPHPDERGETFRSVFNSRIAHHHPLCHHALSNVLQGLCAQLDLLPQGTFLALKLPNHLSHVGPLSHRAISYGSTFIELGKLFNGVCHFQQRGADGINGW